MEAYCSLWRRLDLSPADLGVTLGQVLVKEGLEPFAVGFNFLFKQPVCVIAAVEKH